MWSPQVWEGWWYSQRMFTGSLSVWKGSQGLWGLQKSIWTPPAPILLSSTNPHHYPCVGWNLPAWLGGYMPIYLKPLLYPRFIKTCKQFVMHLPSLAQNDKNTQIRQQGNRQMGMVPANQFPLIFVKFLLSMTFWHKKENEWEPINSYRSHLTLV